MKTELIERYIVVRKCNRGTCIVSIYRYLFENRVSEKINFHQTWTVKVFGNQRILHYKYSETIDVAFVEFSRLRANWMDTENCEKPLLHCLPLFYPVRVRHRSMVTLKINLIAKKKTSRVRRHPSLSIDDVRVKTVSRKFWFYLITAVLTTRWLFWGPSGIEITLSSPDAIRTLRSARVFPVHENQKPDTVSTGTDWLV